MLPDEGSSGSTGAGSSASCSRPAPPFGDRLAADVTALVMDAISPDDTVLRIEVNGGALLFADSVVNRGSLGFVSDGLIGDDPEAVKEKIRERCAALLDEHFEHLLFAHGDPWIGSGRPALQAFAGVPTR